MPERGSRRGAHTRQSCCAGCGVGCRDSAQGQRAVGLIKCTSQSDWPVGSPLSRPLSIAHRMSDVVKQGWLKKAVHSDQPGTMRKWHVRFFVFYRAVSLGFVSCHFSSSIISISSPISIANHRFCRAAMVLLGWTTTRIRPRWSLSRQTALSS